MVSKLKLSILIYFVALQISFAQDIELKWSAQLDAKKTGYPLGVVGKDGTGFYITKTEGGDLYLEKFDLAMKLLWTKNLTVFVAKNKKTEYEDIIITESKIILFTSYFDSKAKTKKLFASYVSKDGILDPKLAEINSFSELKSDRSVAFDVELSKDKKTILVFTDFRERNEEKEKFHYKVIDENFLQMAQSFVELPYTGANVSIIDYLIDNASNIHLIYSVNLKKEQAGNKSNDDKIDYNYYIMSYYPATKQYKEYDMRVGDYVISGMSLIIDDANRFMYVPGYYSDKSVNALKGTMISKIDLLNKSVVYAKKKEFDATFLAEVYAKPVDDDDDKKKSAQQINEDKKDGKIAKGKEQLYNYDIRDLFVNDKDEVVLVSEQYYVRVVTTTTTSSTGTTTTTTTYYYYYMNVMAIKFNDQGERVWCLNIPKYQVTVNDGGYYSSIGVFNHDNKVYLFYNDNPKNGTVMAKKQYSTKAPSKSQLALITIDTDGNATKRVLMPAPEEGKGIATRPKFCVQLNEKENEILILGYISKDYKLGKILIK